MPDYYKILQVDPSADPEVIEGAYKRLARKYHPDLNKAPDAAERTKEINAAYDVLSDPVKRTRYDSIRRRASNPPPKKESSDDPKAEPTAKPKADPPPPRPSPKSADRAPRSGPPKRKSPWVAIGIIVMILIAFGYLGRLANQTSPQPLLSKQSQPNYSLTISVATIVAATRLSQSLPLSAPDRSAPIWANDYVQMTPRSLKVCVQQIDIRRGPSSLYPVLQTTSSGWFWTVYGSVGDWWYLGYDKQQRHSFIPKYALCELDAPTRTTKVIAAGPTAISRPTSPIQSIVQPTATTPLVEFEITRVPRQEIAVCARYAPIRMSPGMNSSVIGGVAKDGKFPVLGIWEDWLYGEIVGPPFVSGFMNRSDTCFPDIDYTAACDDFLFTRWKNGKSDRYAPPCTPQ